MGIKQQWQDAVEEFGERAFKRFFVSQGEDSFSPSSNKEAIEHLNALCFIPSMYLFEHDVSAYGDNAYLMWEYKRFNDGFDYQDFDQNYECHEYIGHHEYVCRRKISAELPFSLERAFSGDVIEGLTGGKWEVKNGHTVYSKFRMKYPPKLEKNK